VKAEAILYIEFLAFIVSCSIFATDLLLEPVLVD